MRKYYKGIVLIIFIISCTKPIAKQENATNSKEPILIEQNNNANELKQIEELSMDNLIGKWLLLNSEGEIDSSGDFILIEKTINGYKCLFNYQGNHQICTLIFDERNYFLLSDNGTKYKIGRSESILGKAYNGIWLVMDDIHLGNFQKEEVLKGNK
ncbi:hypothetical protein [Gracilinema caldarium]|uniref:Uncharacterized protein n=1 Tax=Gracilinema caldarium (strain ATCC 51460 / DSM 7334 / H1) TaxID=744872 RepID=F8EXI9_GRAC1|nr:hypothetical protein [Gracilinema caldarium]AEJ19216.1 hypothetical protein Spica_1068 [Gracilinema caldarium DSM 7334]